jgi:dsDNA-binding SOS-regulon protein
MAVRRVYVVPKGSTKRNAFIGKSEAIPFLGLMFLADNGMTFFEKSGITYPRQRYIPDTRDT